MAKAHKAATEPVFTAELLAEIPHIGLTSTGDDTSFLDAALEARGLVRKIATRVPILSVVLMLVDEDRLAIMPRRVAVSLARVCPLAVKDLPFPSPRIGLSMIWHRRVDNHAGHRWLRDMIKSAARH
jgi:DNA-binding transcriptional LysR family regulator